MNKKTMRIVVAWSAKASGWWRLVGANSKTLASSEVYYSKKNAVRTALKVARSLGIPVFDMHGKQIG